MSRFIDRGANGKISNSFANRQRDDQEELQDDDPELLAFKHPGPSWNIVSAVKFKTELLSRPFNETTLFNAVDNAIMNGTDEAARILWTTASAIERDHPKVIAIATALGIDAAGLDDIFQKAAVRDA